MHKHCAQRFRFVHLGDPKRANGQWQRSVCSESGQNALVVPDQCNAGDEMDVSIALTHSTPDCLDAVNQSIEVFQGAIAVEFEGVQGGTGVRRILIGLQMDNPLRVGDAGHAERGRFDLSTGTYFCGATLHYADWIELDWRRRIIALATSAKAAWRSTAGWLGEDELAAMDAATDRAVARAVQNVPQTLTALRSVYLVFTGNDPAPGVVFAEPAHMSFGPWRFVEVRPEEAEDSARRYFSEPPQAPTMFKLYKRHGTELAYREAWVDEEAVVEHWGICGEIGSTRQHLAPDDEGKRRLLVDLEKQAAAAGFSSISVADHGKIVARKPTVEARWEADLELRYELQSALDRELGSTGLGHCDGGSTGGGSMEVFCFVVDMEAGLAAINRQLAGARFRGFVAAALR